VELGENDRAVQAPLSGYQTHDFFLPYVKSDPVFDSLHSDPRYAEVQLSVLMFRHRQCDVFLRLIAGPIVHHSFPSSWDFERSVSRRRNRCDRQTLQANEACFVNPRILKLVRKLKRLSVAAVDQRSRKRRVASPRELGLVVAMRDVDHGFAY